MQAVAAAGLQNVLDGVFHALDLDDTEISAPSATEIFKAFRGNTLVAAYFKSPFKGPRAKETLAWHLGQTAPELANHVV